MKQVKIDYEVWRDDKLFIEDTAIVKLTEENIKEIADFILEEKWHQTGEFMDIPTHIYDSIYMKVVDDIAEKTFSEEDEEDPTFFDDAEIYLPEYLPTSLLKQLPKDVVDLLPAEIFEEDYYNDDEVLDDVDESELEEVEQNDNSKPFVLKIKDKYQIKGRGVILDGTVMSGRCKVGDKGTLLDKDGNVVCETTVANIQIENIERANLNVFESTKGLQVELVTTLEKCRETKGAVKFVIE